MTKISEFMCKIKQINGDWTTPDTRIFYADGTAEEVYSKRV